MKAILPEVRGRLHNDVQREGYLSRPVHDTRERDQTDVTIRSKRLSPTLRAALCVGFALRGSRDGQSRRDVSHLVGLHHAGPIESARIVATATRRDSRARFVSRRRPQLWEGDRRAASYVCRRSVSLDAHLKSPT
jgi:hypothetical protein